MTTKIFIIVNAGCVEAVYSDNAKVEVEIIDQDGDDRDEALRREDEIAAQYVRVD